MAKSDDALLRDIRERYDYATAQWREIREQGRQDMRYIAGDPWDPKDRKAREDAGRPCLALDELNQYVNQLINDIRQNKRAIKVSPVGSGANDQTAELRGNLIRQIEYRSHAQAAYTTAFENAVQRGYGFFRIVTKYVDDESFDQELSLEPLVNPDLVTPDPDALRSDSSDMQYCFIHESRRKKDFQREFPNAKIRDFSADMQSQYPTWIGEDKIQLAEYWAVESTRRTLLLIAPPPEPLGRGRVMGLDQPPPQPLHVFADALPKPFHGEVLRERDVEDRSVVQYLTNGVEILKKTPWLGKYVPIVSCYGKVLYVDEGAGSKRQILSLVRLARDPYMLYCYYRTCEAELVGMTPKTPFIGYVGQFRGREADWQAAAHEPRAYLEAQPMTEQSGGQLLPLPQRQPYDPPIQALEVGAESARRAIQAAIGTTPLPSQAQRHNEKSGVALARIEHSGQKGSFHFLDHYDDALRHAGRILDDLIPRIYDTAREVGIRKPDDTPSVVRINAPVHDPDQGQVEHRTDVGQHDVTVSTGPSYDSEREQASDFADLLSQNPAIFALIGDLIVKLKNLGPIGDEIADRLTPPQFRKPENGPSLPPEAQQMIAQMQQELQACKGMLADAMKTLETKQLELASRERIAQLEIESREKIAASKDTTAVTTTVIKAEVDRAAALMQAQIDRIQATLDARDAELDRAHQVGMAAQGHAFATDGAVEAQQAALGEIAASRPNEPLNGVGL